MRLIALTITLAFPSGLRAQCAQEVQRLMSAARYDDARAEVQILLKKNGSDDAALNCMGRIAAAADKSGEAVEWFERAVKVNDKSALHHLWLANSLGSEAQKANKLRQPFLARRVKSEFERTISLDPTMVDARHGLVQFYMVAPGVMGGSAEKAAEQIAEIAKLSPMRGHLERAWLAQRSKDLAAEEKEYLAATTTAPDSFAAHSALGQFYKRQKKWSAATAAFEQGLKVNPDAIIAHLSIGGVAAASGENLERGAQEIAHWLAAAPKDAPTQNFFAAHFWLGQIHEAQGKKDVARTEYQAAANINPKNEEAKKALAAISK